MIEKNRKKYEKFSKKRPTDYNPNFFGNVTLRDWSKTSYLSTKDT